MVKKIFLYLFVNLLLPPNAPACTGIQLQASDHSYVNGRTVEFGIPLKISGLFIPRDKELL